MFVKPIECNAFIGYGMFCSIEQIMMAKDAKKFDGTMDDFIASYDLELMPVGDLNKSQEYIIGKKLDYYHNFLALKIKYNNDGSFKELKHMNGLVPDIKMTTAEERDIKQTILRLGVMGLCDYYIIHSFKSNRK